MCQPFRLKMGLAEMPQGVALMSDVSAFQAEGGFGGDVSGRCPGV